MKLAESLSPITKNLDEVKESTQKIGDSIKESPQSSENIKPILQDSHSQTPKLVSPSDDLLRTFSIMNDSKNFSKSNTRC